MVHSKALSRCFRLTGSKGFTLVELMVVVAIIGILASVAISSYRRYQARARQTEAKIGLSGIYTAMQSFFANEGTYTVCIKEIGFEWSTSAKKYYAIGFNVDNSDCGPSSGTSCGYYSWTNAGVGVNFCLFSTGGGWFPANASLGGVAPPCSGGWPCITYCTATPSLCGVHQNSFNAGALGYPFGPTYDGWAIDQDKNLVNFQSGL